MLQHFYSGDWISLISYFVLFLRFFDVRTKGIAYEWKTTATTGGKIDSIEIDTSTRGPITMYRSSENVGH